MRRSVTWLVLACTAFLLGEAALGLLNLPETVTRILIVVAAGLTMDRLVLPVLSLLVGPGRGGYRLFELPVKAARPGESTGEGKGRGKRGKDKAPSEKKAKKAKKPA